MMKQRERGFSLIETILVIIVLGIASYGVLTVFITGLQGSANPLLGVQAIELAEEKMELIIADKHSAARGYTYIISANYPDETPVSGFPQFDRSVAFLDVDGSDLTTALPGSGYRKITVTVSWASDSVSFDSLVTDY